MPQVTPSITLDPEVSAAIEARRRYEAQRRAEWASDPTWAGVGDYGPVEAPELSTDADLLAWATREVEKRRELAASPSARLLAALSKIENGLGWTDDRFEMIRSACSRALERNVALIIREGSALLADKRVGGVTFLANPVVADGCDAFSDVLRELGAVAKREAA